MSQQADGTPAPGNSHAGPGNRQPDARPDPLGNQGGSRTIPIAAAAALSRAQQASLQSLVGLMIPASVRHQVPGADDPLIFKDLLASLSTQTGAIGQLLDRLDTLAGGGFAALAAPEQQRTGELLRAERTPMLMTLMSLVAQCYYRDDRVMRSLEMEVRPPFPQGYQVEDGDWSLLDPVRSRAPMYRDPP